MPKQSSLSVSWDCKTQICMVFQVVEEQVGQAVLHWKLSSHQQYYQYEPMLIMDSNSITWAKTIFISVSKASSVPMLLSHSNQSSPSQILQHLQINYLNCLFDLQVSLLQLAHMQSFLSNWSIEKRTDRKASKSFKDALDLFY